MQIKYEDNLQSLAGLSRQNHEVFSVGISILVTRCDPIHYLTSLKFIFETRILNSFLSRLQNNLEVSVGVWVAGISVGVEGETGGSLD
jgi:hypothetical protein